MAASQQNWNEWRDISCPVPTYEWSRGTARDALNRTFTMHPLNRSFLWKEGTHTMLQPQLSRCQNAPDCRMAKIFSLRVYGDRYYNPPIDHVSTEQASALVISICNIPYRTLSGCSCKYASERGQPLAYLPSYPPLPKTYIQTKKRTPDHRLQEWKEWRSQEWKSPAMEAHEDGVKIILKKIVCIGKASPPWRWLSAAS